MTSAGIQIATIACGAVGAVTRLVVDGSIRTRWPRQFPWATVAINVSGSLLLGFLTGLVLFHGAADATKLVPGTGFCGGYTTFSTAMVETVRLAQQRRWGLATANVLGTFVAATLAAAAGLLLAKA